MKFEAKKLNIINQKWGKELDDFFIQAHCEIREKTSVGGEAFQITIVSPKALDEELQSEDFRYEFGRGYFITSQYNESKILKSIQKLIDGLHAQTWEELIQGLSIYFDVIDS